MNDHQPLLSSANQTDQLPWRDSTLLHQLGPAFGTELAPTPLPGLHWIAHSQALADELALGNWLASDDAITLLGGNAMPPKASPLASVYSGHQFGVWAGALELQLHPTCGRVDLAQQHCPAITCLLYTS